MNNLKSKLNKLGEIEEIKYISIIILLLYPIISILLETVIKSEMLTKYISFAIIAIFTMPGLGSILIKDTKKTISMILIYGAVVIVNYLLHFDTACDTISIIVKNFISCYPIFMITCTIKDKEKFFNSLKIGGYIAIVATLIYSIAMSNHKTILYMNGLTIQLVLIIFLPIILIYAFKNKKIIDIFFSILGLLIISSLSSRTIILITWGFVAILLTIYYCKWFKNNSNKVLKIISILIVIMIIITMIVVIINIKEVASILYNYFNSKGYYIRILRILSEEQNIFNSSGREETVYPAMVEKIKESPIIGNGIGTDRIQISGELYYAHNIVLELFVSYGVIIGSLIIVAIAILIINTIIKTKYKIFIIAMMNSGLLILMLTTSYLSYRGFWLFLGSLINIYINNVKEVKGGK